MSATRSQELRHALAFAGAARVYLRDAMLADALRLHRYALRSLAWIMGAQSRREDAVHALGCTGGLRRVLDAQGAEIEAAVREALRPRPEAHPAELVPHLFESLQVLQRKGVQVEDEDLLDRARAQATVIASAFRIEAAR